MALTRVQWMSESSRSVWEPRILAVERAWRRAEVESVRAGVRLAAYVDVPAEGYRDRVREIEDRGLVALVADLRGSQQGYSARSVGVAPGSPLSVRLAVAQDAESAMRLVSATRRGDDGEIGFMLGYPRCCNASFRSWWGERAEPPVDGSDNAVPAANLFLRWLGVRAVPHLPCRLDCERTAALAAEISGLIPEPERTWLWDSLSCPTLYTARNGIAVVETPILRIVGEADTGTRRVELAGTSWPAEGCLGIEFPLRPPKGCTPRASVGYLRREHEVNGFGSLHAMQDAHDAVLWPLPDTCPGAERVVDLGCGSGRLATLVAGRMGLPAAGCDSSPEAISWARRVYPEGEWWEGSAEGYAPMPGDLILATPERRPHVRGSESAIWLYQYRGEGGYQQGPLPARVEAA